jgi:hypothetical protein
VAPIVGVVFRAGGEEEGTGDEEGEHIAHLDKPPAD